VLGVAELILIGYPLWIAFDLGGLATDTLLRTALPAGIGAIVVWIAASTAWLLPLRLGGARKAARRSRAQGPRGARVPDHDQGAGSRPAAAHRAVDRGGGLTGLFLNIYGNWADRAGRRDHGTRALHAYIVGCVRAAWWSHILGEIRGRLFAVGSPLKRFDDGHFRRFHPSSR